MKKIASVADARKVVLGAAFSPVVAPTKLPIRGA